MISKSTTYSMRWTLNPMTKPNEAMSFTQVLMDFLVAQLPEVLPDLCGYLLFRTNDVLVITFTTEQARDRTVEFLTDSINHPASLFAKLLSKTDGRPRN